MISDQAPIPSVCSGLASLLGVQLEISIGDAGSACETVSDVLNFRYSKDPALLSLPSRDGYSKRDPIYLKGGNIVAGQPEHRSQGAARALSCIHVLNGPNLNLLGEREPEIYGTDTLADVERSCRALCAAAGFAMEFSQTNSEPTLIDQIQAARRSAGIVINPGGCSYSVAVLDALKACSAPVVEVHISNIHARPEPWRARTLTTVAALGVISGLGAAGYELALEYLLSRRGDR